MKLKAFTFQNLFAPGLYCLIVIGAYVVMFVESERNAFRGVGVIFVTLPWSLIFFALARSFTSLHFLDSTAYGSTVIIVLSIAINMVLLFFLCGEREPKS